MKHLKTFATAVAIFTIILVMLAAMAFQISSEQIASESTAAQAPASQLGLGESALASGNYPAAIQYADRALTLLGTETSPTQDLLRYNALVLKGQAQLANGDVLAARNTLALACKQTYASRRKPISTP
ncbi:MAG: hypothetical protein DWQ07_17515 [Chloroflexi bacterium]|nr:MAG: hypothetical protein DWQ07_17515 [Chloroflexota bacterium]